MPRTNIAYEDYEKLVHDRVMAANQYFSKYYSVDEDELFSEALVIFVKTKESWHPKMGSFGTRLWKRLNWDLRNFCRKQHNRGLIHYHKDLPEHPTTISPDRTLMFKERLESLSKEAKEVASILFNGPTEMLGVLSYKEMKNIKGTIRTHLRKKGWSHSKIWTTFGELRAAAREEV